MKTLYIGLFLVVTTFLSSCSVVMSARSGGVDITELSKCATRACILSKDIQPMSHKTDKDGTIIYEEYKAYPPTGSAARAAMHGVLDVATFGIWEAAGTPIEAVKGEKQYYIVKISYEKDGNTIKTVQIAH